MQNHLIHRQTLRARFGTQAEAAGTQAQLAQLLQSPRYLNALDAVLSEFDSAGEWLELDRIEVDLGLLDPRRWEAQLIDRMQSGLRARLQEAVTKADIAEKPIRKTSRQIDFEVFIFFLKNGYLPIGVSQQSGPSVEQIAARLLEQADTRQTEILSGVLLGQPAARLRLIRQFPPVVLRQVLKYLTAGEPALAVLKNLGKIGLKRNPVLEEQLPAFVLLKALENDTAALQKLREQTEKMRAEAPDNSPAALRELLFALTDADLPSLEKTGQTDAAPPPSAAVPTEAIFIENAGIVLLHPFLTACFDALGWLNKGQFKTENTQHRALLMLHYLASGSPKAAESELLLAKILCGAPLHWPLRQGLRLTKKEQNEGESLLRAAIGHWPALKNTSASGLREAFLQREGKLERTQQGWQLTVEQKAQDILLDQLPYGWGLGLIRLPWMKEILQVNWA